MQGCRTEGYEGCKYQDARLKDTKDGGCCLVAMPRSLVAPTRGAGGYIWERLAHYGKPGRSPGAPAREPHASRVTSRSVARRPELSPGASHGGSNSSGWAAARDGQIPLIWTWVPARGGTCCKADWAPRARNPNFVRHTSAAECKQKWRARKLNSGLPAGWLPDLFTSSPAVLYVL